MLSNTRLSFKLVIMVVTAAIGIAAVAAVGLDSLKSALLEDRKEKLRDVVSLACSERERVRGELVGRGLRVAPSKGNFLFFECGRKATDFVEGLLSQGVIVKPWKQPGYDRFIRVSIGSPAENDHFLDALTSLK